MNCAESQDLLLDLAYGELEPARAAEVEAHVAACAPCRAEKAQIDLSPWLGQVKPVDSLEQALALRGQLAAGQSLISRDGYWVGRHFLRVRRAGNLPSMK